MGELRKDYLLDRWVILAEARGKRPLEFHSPQQKSGGKCFFCPGMESETPDEIDRFPVSGPWLQRVFPNKFPAVSNQGYYDLRSDGYYSYSNNFGFHEVIVESPNHNLQLWDLPVEEYINLFNIYKKRILDLGSREGIIYVGIFKNSGYEAGTSLIHTHSQVVAFNKVPTVVSKEAEANSHFGRCVLCDVIGIERRGVRKISENETCLSFTPYASRFHYEAWLFPKRHVHSLTDLSEPETRDLATCLREVLLKLKELNSPFNFFLHLSPRGKDLHFHIEVTPRLAIWAGFEYLSGDVINSVSPESAAAFYRGEITVEKV